MPFDAQSYTTTPIAFACAEPDRTWHVGQPLLGTVSDVNLAVSDLFAPSMVSATAVFRSSITMEVVS